MIQRHNWFSDAIRADMARKAARGEVKLVEDGYDQWRRRLLMANAKPAQAARKYPARTNRDWKNPNNKEDK